MSQEEEVVVVESLAGGGFVGGYRTTDNTPSWGCFATPTSGGFVSPKTLKLAATDALQETLRTPMVWSLYLGIKDNPYRW